MPFFAVLARARILWGKIHLDSFAQPVSALFVSFCRFSGLVSVAVALSLAFFGARPPRRLEHDRGHSRPISVAFWRFCQLARRGQTHWCRFAHCFCVLCFGRELFRQRQRRGSRFFEAGPHRRLAQGRRRPHSNSVRFCRASGSGEVGSGQVTGQIRSGQVRSGQVRSGQVRTGQGRARQRKARLGAGRSGKARDGKGNKGKVR